MSCVVHKNCSAVNEAICDVRFQSYEQGSCILRRQQYGTVQKVVNSETVNRSKVVRWFVESISHLHFDEKSIISSAT